MASVWSRVTAKLPEAFFDDVPTPAAGAIALAAIAEASTGPKLPWEVEPESLLDPDDRVGDDVALSRFERLGEVLGRGGMAKVERARDTVSGREVALKLLHPHLIDNKAELERFRREVALLERLEHGNIIRVLARSLTPPDMFFACEVVDGPTAKELIRVCAPMPVVAAARMMVEVLRAIEHVHERGVVHRDLKPENILLAKSGQVKLCDFGVATDVDQPPPEGLVGTLAYMSPEQARGKQTGIASDLFSLGIVFYELILGTNPFAADSPSITLHRLCEGRAPLVFAADPTIPFAIERVLEGLLAPDPEQRFASASQPRQILERFLLPLAERYEGVLMRCHSEPEVTQVLCRNDQAEAELNRALAELPRTRSQASQTALALFRATLLDPSDEQAATRLHHLASRHGFSFGTSMDADVVALEKQLIDDDENVELLKKLADKARKAGDLLRAVIALKQLHRLTPDDTRTCKTLTYFCGTDTDAFYGTGVPPA
jgi:tRNA A-37 threonylcarbamoyl transferase component Bud32